MRAIGLIGNLSWDRVEGSAPQPGGGPFHGARALRALGWPAVLAARCSEADRPALVGALTRFGIPVVWRPASATAGFSFVYENDVRVMTVDALPDPWTPGDVRAIEPALARVGWLHIAPLFQSDFPAETVAELARGRRLSLDGQGLVRRPTLGALDLGGSADPDVLVHVSILKLAEEEALALLGGFDERSLRTLGVPEVVVTLGSRGAIVFADGVAEHVGTRAVRADPTGAGDAFAVAYLAARRGRQAPQAAARSASALVGGLLRGRLA